MKYIGIKKPDSKSNGNLNTVWVEQKDGSFKCEQTGYKLPKWAIENDLMYGYIKRVEE